MTSIGRPGFLDELQDHARACFEIVRRVMAGCHGHLSYLQSEGSQAKEVKQSLAAFPQFAACAGAFPQFAACAELECLIGAHDPAQFWL